MITLPLVASFSCPDCVGSPFPVPLGSVALSIGLLVLVDSFLSFVSDPIFFIIDLVEGFFRIF